VRLPEIPADSRRSKFKKSISVLGILSILIFIHSRDLNSTKTFEEIKQSYHFSNQLKGWEPVGIPQVFIGDDLFLFINGGADLYYEYGFTQVMSLEYKNKNNKSINLEIYEMKDSKGAYGIFTFKTGKNGEKMAIGSDALLENYYLNFWKGNFLVTLTGFDSEKETINGLINIARAVEKKIKKTDPDYPSLTKLIWSDCINNGKTIYLKGNLALFNFYQFDGKNIFGLKEGIIADYQDVSVLIFKYIDAQESLKWFQHSKAELKSISKFSTIPSQGKEILIQDNKKKTILIKPYQSYIIIIISDSEDKIGSLYQKVTKRIKQNQKNP